jgi:hypothetical protein
VGGIHQDHAHDAVRVVAPVLAHVDAARRHADEHVWPRDFGDLDEAVQARRHFRRVRRAPDRLAPVHPRAVVGAGPSHARDGIVDEQPARRAGREARLEKDRGPTLAAAVHVQAQAVHIDEAPGRGVGSPIDPRTLPLVERARQDERHEQADDASEKLHGAWTRALASESGTSRL